MRLRPTVLALLALLPVVAAAQNEPLGFRATVTAHLDAIHRHDLDALMATVTTGDSLVLLFPDGTLIRSRQAFLDVHRAWFADTTWTMTFEPVSLLDTPAMGTALVRYTITDDTPRSGRQAYLALTFVHEDGSWRLVQDQNTAIARAE